MTTELFSALLGIAMPYVIELVKTLLKSEKKLYGFVIAYVTSILAATASTYFADDFSLQSVLSSIGAILLTSQTMYNLYFKNSNVSSKIQNL